MITIYICSRCECPCLVTWPTPDGGICRNCAQQNRWSGGDGDAMGSKLIRVIMPNGQQVEMSVTKNKATVDVDGERLEFPSSHAILAGAARKIRQ